MRQPRAKITRMWESTTSATGWAIISRTLHAIFIHSSLHIYPRHLVQSIFLTARKRREGVKIRAVNNFDCTESVCLYVHVVERQNKHKKKGDERRKYIGINMSCSQFCDCTAFYVALVCFLRVQSIFLTARKMSGI